jgi:hypothetical protein
MEVGVLKVAYPDDSPTIVAALIFVSISQKNPSFSPISGCSFELLVSNVISIF